MRFERHHHTARRRTASVGTALAMLVAGTLIGATTQHFASAGVSSGERAVLITIEPCRLADTRGAPNTVGPRSVAIGAGDTHTIDAQQTGTPCSGKIPADASALSLNVTALGATELSFLTIWADGTRPNAASLNPAPGEPPVPNAVTTAVSSSQQFQIYNNAGSTNVVVDVTGYYVDHNHDDRYYTEAESDARFVRTSAVDEIHLGTADLAPAETGSWEYSTLFWSHPASADQDCLIAPVDIPVGRSVESIKVRHSTTVATTVGVLLGSVTRTPITVVDTSDFLDLHLIDADASFAASTLGDIDERTISSDPSDVPTGITITPRAADHDPLLELCTDGEIAIVGATVLLS